MCRQNKLPAFRERLNRLLIESGETIVAFAEMLGTSRQSLGYYLNGERVPDAIMVRQICERCHVSADWLLGLSQVRMPDADVQAVCGYSGLTEAALGFFRHMKDEADPQPLELMNIFFSNELARVKFLLSLQYLYNAYTMTMLNMADESNEEEVVNVEQIYQRYRDKQSLEFDLFLSQKYMNEALDTLFYSGELLALRQQEEIK